MNVKWEVSWRKKGLWNITKKRMLEDRGAVPKEDVDILREYKPCTKKTFSAVGWEKMWKVKTRKKETMNKQAKEE